MNTYRIIRFLGIDSLKLLDEDALYEIHRRIEEPRAAKRIAHEFRRTVKRHSPQKNRFGYIVVWRIRCECVWKFIRIAGQHLPSVRLTTELRKYKFLTDERIYYRKLISRPSLGLSPPALPGSTVPYKPGRPDYAAPCHHGLALSARVLSYHLLV